VKASAHGGRFASPSEPEQGSAPSRLRASAVEKTGALRRKRAAHSGCGIRDKDAARTVSEGGAGAHRPPDLEWLGLRWDGRARAVGCERVPAHSAEGGGGDASGRSRDSEGRGCD